ncbi:hypothetical protein ACROYT_G007843 [Oculina patagonica]
MACLTHLNRRLIFALLTVFILSKASSLRCNICQSTQSWEHCQENTTEAECTFTDARCVKYNYEKTVANSDKKETMFARGCLPQSQCSSSLLPACKDLQKSGDEIKATCDVSCCGEDLCNSQVNLSSSILFLMAMFLVHVIFAKVLP